MMNGVLFFFGCRRLSSSAVYAASLTEMCLCYGISYTDFRWEENGGISFLCGALAAGKLAHLCVERGIEIKVLGAQGLPVLLRRCFRRTGLILGALLSVILILLSGRVVWDIRIDGNESMTDSQVLEELSECGLKIGSYIPKLQTGELENRVLLRSDRISWIAIVLDGTVAEVQVVEHREEPPMENMSHPANLIAAADGQIELLQLYRGAPVVKVGQAVKKGELLVSGLYETSAGGYRYTRAAGSVLARTEHILEVEIPLSCTEKVYQDAKYTEGVLNFFGFSIKIFKNSRNLTEEYDIIKVEKSFSLPGFSDLPLSLELTRCLPFEEHEVERTPEVALELAYVELDRRLALLSRDTQLLKKRVVTTLTDTALILRCEVLCVEDIAMSAEFEIVE